MSKPILLPGLIDCHVHFREPGLEHKATMQTEAAAACAGGVTTACEMPNTIPPTVTIAALADKVRRAAEISDCDIHFFFGATEPAHLQTLRELWTGTSAELQRLQKRCCGLKLFLDHSTGNQKAGADVIDDAFKLCAELGIVAVCHCEDPEINRMENGKWKMENDISFHSKMRPPESEAKSIEFALGLAKKYGTHLHVAHLSTRAGLEIIRTAKKSGITVTCEVAPHHLFLTTDDYQTLGTLAKMNPPLRSKEDQAALWEGIKDGTVDCIATDHAPHTLEEKQGVRAIRESPLLAPSGVPGVETMLPLLLTVANGSWPHPRSDRPTSATLTIDDIKRLCFENPNRIFQLGKSGEGKIEVDMDAQWTIKGKELHSKCGWSPYEGWRVEGKITRIISA